MTDPKSDPKSEQKTDPKPDAKTDPKPDAKTDPKPDAKPDAKPARSPKLRITSRVEGFRRAGVAHPGAPVEYKAGAFSAEELAALKGEPNLVVEEL